MLLYKHRSEFEQQQSQSETPDNIVQTGTVHNTRRSHQLANDFLSSNMHIREPSSPHYLHNAHGPPQTATPTSVEQVVEDIHQQPAFVGGGGRTPLDGNDSRHTDGMLEDEHQSPPLLTPEEEARAYLESLQLPDASIADIFENDTLSGNYTDRTPDVSFEDLADESISQDLESVEQDSSSDRDVLSDAELTEQILYSHGSGSARHTNAQPFSYEASPRHKSRGWYTLHSTEANAEKPHEPEASLEPGIHTPAKNLNTDQERHASDEPFTDDDMIDLGESVVRAPVHPDIHKSLERTWEKLCPPNSYTEGLLYGPAHVSNARSQYLQNYYSAELAHATDYGQLHNSWGVADANRMSNQMYPAHTHRPAAQLAANNIAPNINIYGSVQINIGKGASGSSDDVEQGSARHDHNHTPHSEKQAGGYRNYHHGSSNGAYNGR
jgi:hypothetical protein